MEMIVIIIDYCEIILLLLGVFASEVKNTTVIQEIINLSSFLNLNVNIPKKIHSIVLIITHRLLC